MKEEIKFLEMKLGKMQKQKGPKRWADAFLSRTDPTDLDPQVASALDALYKEAYQREEAESRRA